MIEEAIKLGIAKVIFACSETTYAVCFADGELKPDFVPIDETHPTVPHHSYAMRKVCNEMTTKSFQARTGSDIYSLRINNAVEPDEYSEIFPAILENPAPRRRNVFAYIDARYLGRMVDCCLKTDGLEHEVFNVSNDDMSVGITSSEVINQFYQGVEIRSEMEPDEPFFSNKKAKSMVGFHPKHSWRHVVVSKPLTEERKKMFTRAVRSGNAPARLVWFNTCIATI